MWRGIAAGTRGDIWFGEYDGNHVGRITSSGSLTEYSIPTAKSHTVGITSGPDGNVWFAEVDGNRIGKLNVKSINPRPASLTVDGLKSLNAGGKPQTIFHPQDKGYILVSWTVRDLQGTASIIIKRTYEVPNGAHWRAASSAQSTVPVHNGPGSATFQFLAPVHYAAYRIEVSIKFGPKWSTTRAITVGVRR